MDCKECITLLGEQGIGKEWTKEQQQHLQSCPACQMAYTLREDCQQLDEESEVPASFQTSWRQAIRKEDTPMEKKPILSVHMKKWLAAAAALVLLIGGTAISKQYLNPYTSSKETVYPMEDSGYAAPRGLDSYAAKSAPGEAMVSMAEQPIDRAEAKNAAAGSVPAAGEKVAPAKMIRTIDMTLSTRTFDKDLENIQATLARLKGYVETSSLSSERSYSRYANLRLRLPAENLDAFVAEMKGIGRALSVNESAEDVSERYTDVETRLATQQAKMTRLQELLKQAISVTEMLKIEASIADTQYMIDSLSGSLRGMDSKVSYATVSIYLKEERASDTVEVKEATLGERIVSALKTMWAGVRVFFSDMLVFLVVALPFIVVIAVVILLVKKLIKRRKNKK